MSAKERKVEPPTEVSIYVYFENSPFFISKYYYYYY